MKPGSMITTKPIQNNGGTCFRVRDMPKNFEWRGDAVVAAQIVDKLFHGEVGMLVEISEEGRYARIVTPRGIVGWIKVENIGEVEVQSPA